MPVIRDQHGARALPTMKNSKMCEKIKSPLSNPLSWPALPSPCGPSGFTLAQIISPRLAYFQRHYPLLSTSAIRRLAWKERPESKPRSILPWMAIRSAPPRLLCPSVLVSSSRDAAEIILRFDSCDMAVQVSSQLPHLEGPPCYGFL